MIGNGTRVKGSIRIEVGRISVMKNRERRTEKENNKRTTAKNNCKVRQERGVKG